MRKLLILMVLFSAGCSLEQNNSEHTLFDAEKREVARTLAENELVGFVSSGESSWTADSKVTELFPVYLPGKTDPSYYECKIETNGSDAGYILVNVDAADLPIVEASESGKTVTEIYREKYGDDISVIRYSPFYSEILKGRLSDGRGVNEILDQIGWENSDTINRLKNAVTAEGVYPGYKKEELEDLHKEALLSARAETRVIAASLKNPTEKYYQHRLASNGSPVGCGPTAWTIVYAYWKNYKNFNKLFDGKNPDSCCHSVMEEIAELCDTTYGKTYGMTLPSKMDNGINYALKYGYSRSNVTNENGTYYPKFADIEGSLRGDRPVIMGIHADGIGAIDHYVVVVGARKQQKKVLGKWKDRGWITYQCNFGWNEGTDRWIYAKDNEGDGNYQHHSTYQIWMINLAE